MARNFVAASSHKLKTSSWGGGSTLPLTMACWFRPVSTSPANPYTLIDLALSGKYHSLDYGNVAGAVRARTYDGTTSAGADTSTTSSAGAWAHACGVWSATNSRTAYLNGGGKTTNTATSTPGTNLSHLTIGLRDDGLFPMDGDIAEAAIWNVALDDAEVAALAAGFSPALIRPTALVAYWPIDGQYSPEIELVGRNELTVTGATAAAHCRIIRPHGPILIPKTPVIYHIGGVTKNAAGSAVGSATVKLFRTSDDALMATTTSDGGGNYTFSVGNNTTQYYVTAFKAGTPNITGITDNTLVGS